MAFVYQMAVLFYLDVKLESIWVNIGKCIKVIWSVGIRYGIHTRILITLVPSTRSLTLAHKRYKTFNTPVFITVIKGQCISQTIQNGLLYDEFSEEVRFPISSY